MDIIESLQFSLLATDFEGLSDSAITDPISSSSSTTSNATMSPPPFSDSYLPSLDSSSPTLLDPNSSSNPKSSNFNEINELFQHIQDSKIIENKLKKKIHKKTDLLAITVMKTLDIEHSRTMKLNHLLKPYNRIFKQDPKLKELIMKRITRKYNQNNL